MPLNVSSDHLPQGPDSSSEDEDSPERGDQDVAQPSTSTLTSTSTSNGPLTDGPAQHKLKRPRPCDYCRFRKVCQSASYPGPYQVVLLTPPCFSYGLVRTSR